jgi:3-oxosteroid 1-dehydrogenase
VLQRTPDFMIRKLFRNGYMKRANTLEELAREIGVDAEGLKESVAKNNEYARTGIDLEFQRGANIYDQYYGDLAVEPNPCLGPIGEAPFYAIEAFAGELGTKGGLMVDEFARVVTSTGEPIDGLYAIGNCSSAVMGRSYPGAGATIGPATTFGYVAAAEAMRNN